jgi:murein DD-endopeptidase MepM/ murein hydrolase activator NlpD
MVVQNPTASLAVRYRSAEKLIPGFWRALIKVALAGILFFWPLFIVQSQSQNLTTESLPLIHSLQHGDPLFDQILQEVAHFHQSKARRQSPKPLVLMRYRVKEGESLFMIAARLTLPPAGIASLNQLVKLEIKIGQELIIPSQPGLFEVLNNNSTPIPSSGEQIVIFQIGDYVHSYLFRPENRFTPSVVDILPQPNFVKPLQSYRISSAFGLRPNPFSNRTTFHNGVDLVAAIGSPIRTIEQGVVREIGFDALYGNYIIIDHPHNWRSFYAHLQHVRVRRGAAISKGHIIASLGNTGRTTGAHLHLEIIHHGQTQDPTIILKL